MNSLNTVEVSGDAPGDVEELVRFVLHEKGISGAEVSVHFCDAEEIARLNREYRGIDAPTDVLSFPMHESLSAMMDALSLTPSVLLGDLVLSEPVIRQNCETYGVSFSEELTRLVIHGMLHLLGETHQGYDHGDPMLAEQERLVKRHLEAKEQ